LLKRTSINSINKKLKENSSWNVLDIGCGYTANKHANTVADIKDLSTFYKDKKFIKITNKKLPFRDNEFDFVITSHVIEHVEDFQFFISEIERISKQGYIELPTRLGDNIVFENLNDHIWWFKYDDELNSFIVSKKNQILEPFASVSTAKKLESIFRESLIMEIYWKDKVNYKIDSNLELKLIDKINFSTLIKKYFSKKIRRFFRSNHVK
jgi:ubiquinone/menaquinone biosynthesis C-methylase UbiE|tara:strand:+ start:629 stop:1258 length:630 start_codon:yes stop_codon:yes gene_type:complete